MDQIINGVTVAMTAAEIAEFNAGLNTEAEILAERWEGVRNHRNLLLSQTDWRASSDLTLSDDWKTYRQALRDITTQSDPTNITWPTKPS
tara:strand:- start:1361 stop:1630 length:270 start_codon:yes stop_codon:yes gene_type:complete